MPCPHNEITIVQRSQRQSAVAAAAYQSGEKLFCEYDQQVKHYPEKRGIVHNEILLPPNAPQEYADRNTLWNAAEAVEKQWNSQLARRWVLTIPREIPPDQYAVLVREFCEQQFVSKGMIADFAIHDPHPPGHNPHAHVMLTMRAMDEHGKWLPKSRKVYDLDENGERIKLPSGRWKSHKEDTVDWNDQKYCEIWRHEWEVIQNRYLEANDRPERVDLRSYARQGLDIVPTVHEGAAVRQMEKRGIQTNIGNLNREIRAANRLMKSIRQLIQNLKGWITELGEKRKELLAQKAAEEATLLPNLLMKYMEIRKEERKDWTRAGQNRGTSQDLKAVSEALSYLRQKGLSTVEDLEAFLESSGKSAADYRNQMKPKEARSKVIDGILASRTDCKECKAVYEKYQKKWTKILFCDCGMRFQIEGYDKTANGGKNMRLICARSKMFKKKDAARALNGIPCPAPYASEWKLELMAREVFRTVWKENAEDILGLLRMLDANLNTTGTPNDGNQLENKLSALNEELDDLVSQRASRSITMDDFLSKSTEINNEIINVEGLLQSSIQEQRPKARLDMHSIEAALSDDASFPDGKIEPGFLDRYTNRIVKSNNHYIWMLQLMNVQQIMPIQSERQPIAMVTYKSGVPYDIEKEQIGKQDKESAGPDCATICRPQDFFLNMSRTKRKRKLVEWLESCQENQVSVLDEKIPLLSFAVDFVTAYEYQKSRGIKIHPGLWKDMRVDIFLVKKEN